jgi:hypothetical protein
VTLKSDIQAQLDNITRIQKEAVTPEARIQAYRENLITLNRVKNEVKDLQTLVSSISSTNTMAGFIGGAQSLSLWGIIFVIITGVVLVSIYMRIMIGKAKREGKEFTYQKAKRVFRKLANKKNLKTLVILGLLFLSSAVSAKLTWTALNAISSKRAAKTAISKVEIIKLNQTLAQITPVEDTRILGVATTDSTTTAAKILGKVSIVLPADSNSSVKLRAEPNLDSEVLGKIWYENKVDKYDEKDDWTQVGINIKVDGVDKYVIGWVRNQYIKK